MLSIHPNARTTPAVRQEIARSSEPTGVLAKRFGVSTVDFSQPDWPGSTTNSPRLVDRHQRDRFLPDLSNTEQPMKNLNAAAARARRWPSTWSTRRRRRISKSCLPPST